MSITARLLDGPRHGTIIALPDAGPLKIAVPEPLRLTSPPPGPDEARVPYKIGVYEAKRDYYSKPVHTQWGEVIYEWKGFER